MISETATMNLIQYHWLKALLSVIEELRTDKTQSWWQQTDVQQNSAETITTAIPSVGRESPGQLLIHCISVCLTSDLSEMLL